MIIDEDVSESGIEDSPAITITLIAYGIFDFTPATFKLASLPLHGVLTDALGNPLSIGVAYNADTYDNSIGAGAWVLTLTFVPDADWNGQTVFTWNASDPTGTETSDGATATIDVTAENDAPTVAITNHEPASTGETQVNTFTTSDQGDPAIAPLANGGHVVVWESHGGQDGSLAGIYMQRFDASGTPDGGETRVNTVTSNDQENPEVATLADGSIVVVWQTPDASGTGIVSQRYDASGAALGGETAVNTTTTNGQLNADVGALVGGGYVVVWESTGQDLADGQTGIYMQRFDASGAPVGLETLVNTFVAGAQAAPRITGLADGGYVVTWQSLDQDGSGNGIYAQRYDVSGVAQGGETLVSTTTAGDQEAPGVTALADGGWLIVWESPDSDDRGVFAQRFDASGAAVGGETQLNTHATIDQGGAQATGLPDGGYVVTWQSNGQDGSGYGVYARRFDAGGTPEGAEQLVNTVTSNHQAQPAIAAAPDGGYVIAWASRGQDGSVFGVYSQRFDPNFTATEGVALDLKGNIALDDVDDSGGSYTLTLSVTYGSLAVDPGSSAALVDDSDPQNIVITGTLADIQALLDSNAIGSVTFTTGDDLPPATTDLTITIDDGTDQTSDTATIVITPVNDAPYLDLDFTDISASGSDSAASWTEGDDPVALAFAVELDDDDADNSYGGATVTAAFTVNGSVDDVLSILSVGDGLGEIRVDGSDVYYEGTLVGSFTGGTNGNALVVTFNEDARHCAVELLIASIAFENTSGTPDTSQRTVTVTLVDGGGTDNGGGDTASANVVIDVNLSGNNAPTVTIVGPPGAVGDETLVNTTTTDAQRFSSVAALGDGGYVVTWSANGAGDDSGVFMQLYDASGAPVGSETLVNTTSDFDQQVPSVTALSGGGFVVTWFGNGPGDSDGVFAQLYDASGAPVGGETLVNTTTVQGQQNPSVAALGDGGYIVTWLSYEQDGSMGGIYAQRFDASGAPQGSETPVNTTTAQFQGDPSVTGLSGGGYVVTWTSQVQDSGVSQGVYAQRYDAAGVPQGGEVLVNTTVADDQANSAVTGLADGGYVVTWSGNGTGDASGVFMQRYDSSGAPLGGEVRVNTQTDQTQHSPSITALADGGFVVTWMSSHDDIVDFSIYAQRYDASGAPVGGEVLVNTTTEFGQELPIVAGLGDGSFVVAWFGNGAGDDVGVFTQRFDTELAATEQVPLDLKGLIVIGDVDAGSGDITVTLEVSEGVLNVDPGTSGVDVDDSDQQFIILTGTLAELQELLGSNATGSVSYTYDDDFLPVGPLELAVTVDDGIDLTTDTVTINLTPVNDPPVLDLDFFEPGNDSVAHYAEGDAPAYLAFYATFEDDNEEWDGATLTIAIDGATADDQLTIEDIGTGLGEISIDGSDILYEGDVIGSFTGGTNGDPLVITFNEDACGCAIELVAASILYSNSGTGLGVSTRDVDFTFVDGSDTVTSTSVLEISPAPSAPDIDTGGDGAAYQATAAALTGVVITDAGDPVTGLITVQLSVAHGTLAVRTDVPGGIDSSAIVNGSGTGRGITIVATPDQINATLAAANGLAYTSDADFYGTDGLTIRANDGVPASPVAISTLTPLPFGALPSAVAFTDLDGDLLDDLVLGFADPLGTDPGFVFVLASGPPGGFPLDAGAPEDFVFSDFDGDGETDIGFAAYLDDGSSYVAYASTLTGDIEMIAAVPYALDLASGDFDGNGLLDLAVADSDNGRIGVILQTAPGVFAAPVYSPTTGLLAIAVATGDFNGDGVLDLLKGNLGTLPGFGSPGSVDLLLGNGDGTFAAPVEVLTGPSNVGGLIVADFNNDGFEDFAFASIANATPGSLSGVQVVLGNGDGSFDAAVSYVTTVTGSPSRVVAGDINGDGIDDLVVANFDDPGTLSILVGNGDGSFQAAVDVDTGDLPYVIALGDPDGDGDLDIMVGNAGDGSFEAFGSDIFHRGDTEVKTIIVNGLSVAVNDAGGSVAENATVAIDVVANDTDPENDARSVAMIAGQAATVGVAVTLASGARATLNANGTITYDPNGAFNSLIGSGKAAWTGGTNLSAPDSFSYTLANGTAATVSVTVTGVDSATGDIYVGSAGNDVLAGYPGNDFFRADQGGNDRVAGGSGDDTIYFGGAFTTADTVRGGLGNDIMILQGSYALTFTNGGVLAIEMLLLMSAADTRYGASGTGTNTYDFTAIDSLVQAGVQMTIQGNNLHAGETLHFDGSAETDGSFRLIGGAADDVLTGGAKDDMVVGGLGVDILSGGLGDDLFVFRTTGESTLANPDQILDFNAGDRIDLRGIDAILGIGGNDAFTFIGSGAFSNTAGELRAEFSAGTWSVTGDVDGDGDADFLIHVQTTNGHPLGSGDFWL